MKRALGLLLAAVFCGIVLSYGVTQEVPVGRVKGAVTMAENDRPLADAAVTLSLVGVPEEDRPRSRGVETRADGTFELSNVPSGVYRLEVIAEHHRLPAQFVEVEEGKTQTLALSLNPDSPYLELYSAQKVFTPDETPQVELHGFVDSDKVNIAVYRLDIADIAKKGGLQETLSPLAGPNAGDVRRLSEAGPRIADLSHTIRKRDAEGAFIEPLEIGRLKEGYYFVTCTAGEKRASTALNVTHLALVTKSYEDRTLCFATDITTGKPVQDVEILAQAKTGLQSMGKTGADGTYAAAMPEAPNSHAVVVGRKGDSTALVGFFDERSEAAKVNISGYCERPAYRPGDEIHFKGIVRRFKGDGYELPGQGTANITVKDPDGNPYATLTARVSAHGTFSGSFRTSPESKPGGYDIECRAFGGKSQGIFANVVAYRKPEYSVEVTSDRPFYTMGDRAAATVECRYYYGGPVVGAKVKASVYRSPAWHYEDEEGNQFESGGGGEYSEEIQAVTDASGRARIVFPTRADDDPDVFSNDYLYTVSASVTEDDSKYFDGEGQVKVVRGDHDLSIEVQNPVLTLGESADLLVKTTDPVDAHKPSPNHTVTIEVGRVVWTRNESVFIRRSVLTATTGPDGLTHVKIPVDRRESLSFRATSQDSEGRKILADAWAYVEGSPAQAEAQKGNLEVTLDKREYVPGQSARALIQTDMPGGSALISMESDGVRWQRVVPLTSPSTLVPLPIVPEDSPNAFVGVVYVREKRFLQTTRRVSVKREDRDLKIEVKSDRDVYKPGETAKLTVRTLDAAGKPVPADVSVGVVDEGIYAIAEDQTDLKSDLFPERYQGVRTNYSFPELYLDGGDKGTSNIPLRKKFRDTAAWVPSVWTGAQGEASLNVPLPDNLTQWRVTAVGISDASQVGKAVEDFRVRKSLMARLQMPQYLVTGDRQRMTVVVANDTGADSDVNVEISATGLTLSNAGQKKVRVANGRPEVVEFDAVAGEAGKATVTARIWIDGGPSDGVQQSFPIEPHGRQLFAARSGEGAASFTLPIRATADPAYGSLKITLNSTMAADLVQSLEGLVGFPYGCTEQTMSRFLPSVLVEKMVTDLALPRPASLSSIDNIVRDSEARLDRMQHSDGGWGWWEYDESSPFMTGLVLDGLDRAKQAGHPVNLKVEEALKWGMEYLAKPPSKEERVRDRFYLVYCLLRHGQRGATRYLKDVKLSSLTPDALAVGAMALHEAGDDERAMEALRLLAERAQGGQGQAYWPSEEGAWGSEPTAMALVAFEAIRPEDPIVPRIVRHLQAVRKGAMWMSTRDTAYSLVGLTAYLGRTKELSGTSTVTVAVNGKTVRTVTLSAASGKFGSDSIEIPRRSLGGGPVKVEIGKTGTGACYYSAELRTLDVAESLLPESSVRGFTVDRRYYRLEPRRLENGNLKLLPSPTPVTRFTSGDLIRVELVIDSDVDREFVMIEEPTPSSCRVQEREEIGPYEEWGYWWSRTVIRDDRVAFFAVSLPAGRSRISYTMRAEQAGVARAMPTNVANMYDPATQTSSGETVVEVTR